MTRKIKRNSNGGFTVNPNRDISNFSVAELIEEHTGNYNEVLDNIEAALEAEELDQEEAEEYALQAEEDYQLRIAEALGVEVEDAEDEEDYEDDEAEYSAASDWANFSAGTAFGQAILELAEEEFEDPIEGLEVVAEECGLTGEQLVGLIEGRFYPDAELAARIGEIFQTTAENEEAYNGLLLLAEEAVEDLVDDEEVTEDEDDEEDAEYSALRAEHDELLAQFSQTQTENAIKDELRNLEARCQEGVSNHWLPPAAMKVMLASGNFNTESDLLAAFSVVCEGNNVDPATELYAMNYALNIFERCGQYGTMFSQLGEIPFDQEEAEFSQAEDQAVEVSVSNFYKSGFNLIDRK